MKPHDSSSQLNELLRAARQAHDTRDCQAPLGFSTRVAARAFEGRENALSALFERLSWKALAVSCLLMAATVASGYGLTRGSALASAAEEDSELSDPVTEMLELNT